MKRVENFIKSINLVIFFIGCIIFMFLTFFILVDIILILSIFLSAFVSVVFTFLVWQLKTSIEFFDLYDEICKDLVELSTTSQIDLLLNKCDLLSNKITNDTSRGLANTLFDLINRKKRIINNFTDLHNNLINEKTN